MNAVIEASADFLRRKGARADSAEIQKELVRSGVLEDGPRDRSRSVACCAARAKTRRNYSEVRGLMGRVNKQFYIDARGRLAQGMILRCSFAFHSLPNHVTGSV